MHTHAHTRSHMPYINIHITQRYIHTHTRTHTRAENSLLDWMAEWMSQGAALAITYNRQNVLDGAEIPDCWHAQGVFSVDLVKRIVGLTNPVKVVTEEEVRGVCIYIHIYGRDSRLLACTGGVQCGPRETISWFE